MTCLEVLKQGLAGKKLKHTNDHGRVVVLEIEDFVVSSGSRDLAPATQANDWYPPSESWTHFYITFVDGSRLQVYLEKELEFV